MKKFLLIFAAGLLSITAFGQKETEFHLNEVYSLQSNGTITLSADDAEVKIIGEDRNDVAVKIDYIASAKGIKWGESEFRVEVIKQGGDLGIKEYKTSSGTRVGFVSSEYTIEIRAPKGASLDINGDDDNYQITKINGAISIDADDADIKLTQCGGSKFYFDLDDGDIKMDQGSGELRARVDDGDIEVANGSFTEIDYRGDDGRVAIETSIGPNALFRFNGDDSTYDMIVTQGGGTFTINHDDGRIDYDDNFRLMDKEEDLTVLSLTGGRSKIIFSGDDIRVSLASVQKN